MIVQRFCFGFLCSALCPLPAAVFLIFAAAGQVMGEENWEPVRAGDDSPLAAIAEGGGSLVAVGTGRIVVSTDGQTWTTSEVDAVLTSVSYLQGSFYALGRVGDTAGMMISDNGISWETVPFADSGSNRLEWIAYGNGRFLVTGDRSYLAVSENGEDWQELESLPASASALAFGNDHFVAADGRSIFLSENGEEWSASAEKSRIRLEGALHFSGGRFYGGGEAGVPVSDDGWFWYSINAYITEPSALAVREESILAAATSGLFHSGDGGRNWTERGDGLEDESVNALHLSEDFAYAVTGSGAIYRRPAHFALRAVAPWPESVARLKGERLELVALAGGSGEFEYQWLKEGEEIPGATTERFAVDALAADDAGEYECRVTAPGGEEVKVNTEVEVTVEPPMTYDYWFPRPGGSVRSHSAIVSMAVNDDVAVGVGAGGAMILSRGGRHWESRRILGRYHGNYHPWVVFEEDRFFAMGPEIKDGEHTLLSSFDGYHWEAYPVPSRAKGIAAGLGQFVLAAEDGAYVSDDLKSWERIEAIDYWGRGVAFGNGRFVIQARGQTAWSDDGNTWEVDTYQAGATFRGVAYGFDRFWRMERGFGGLHPTPVAIESSADGTAWINPGIVAAGAVGGEFTPARATQNWYETSRGEVVVLLEDYNQIALSTDGWRWARYSPANSPLPGISSIAEVGDRLIGAGSGGVYTRPLGVPPEITSSPDQFAVRNPGETLELHVEALGSKPLEYQWKLEGAPIEGATEPSLAIAPGASDGPYRLTVRNIWGKTATDEIFVRDLFDPDLSPANWKHRDEPPPDLPALSAAYGNDILVILRPRRMDLYGGGVWSGGDHFDRANIARAVVFGKGRFVAVGAGLMHSEDGVRWRTGDVPAEGELLADVAFGGDEFLAVGAEGTAIRSADGRSWELIETNVSRNFGRLSWGEAGYVAVNADLDLLFSTDGSDWEVVDTLPDRINRFAYGNGQYVGVGDNGLIVTSSTGQEWEQIDSGISGTLHDVIYDNGLWIAAAGNRGLLTSKDAIVWTERSDAPVSELVAVTSTELVVASEESPAAVHPHRLPPVPTGSSPAEAWTSLGESVALDANVDGSQPVHYRWKRAGDETVLAEEPAFFIETAEIEHAGEYYLAAANTSGEVEWPVNLRVTSTYDAWVEMHFGPDAADSQEAAPDADPEGSGLPNLLAYAHGIVPGVVDRNRLPQTRRAPAGEIATMELQYHQLRDAVDLDWIVEASDDLIEWQEALDIEILREPLEGGIEKVTIREATEPAERRRFLRLRVNQVE